MWNEDFLDAWRYAMQGLDPTTRGRRVHDYVSGIFQTEYCEWCQSYTMMDYQNGPNTVTCSVCQRDYRTRPTYIIGYDPGEVITTRNTT